MPGPFAALGPIVAGGTRAVTSVATKAAPAAARAGATRAASRGLGRAALRGAGRRVLQRNGFGKATDLIEQLASRRVTSPEQAAEAGANAIDALREAADGLAKYLPHFGHAITVNVRGGPAADLRRIWYLALAACFGRYKRGLSGIWGRSINAQWNITGKEVSITLAYTFTGVLENAGGAAVDETGLSLMQRGPDQVTIGDGFPSWMRTTRQNAANGGLGWVLAATAGVPFVLLGGALRKVANTAAYQPDTKNTGLLSKFMQSGTGASVVGATPVDPRSLIQGWRVDNDTVATQPSANRVFQPYRNRPVPNIFRELPVRVSFGPLTLVEKLPYRRVKPGVAETTFYVVRGGVGGLVPILPDDGRVITTGEKRDPRVQPPKPPVDGVSRGNALAMITAVLSSPGILVAPPEDTENTLGSEGVYAYVPGSGRNGYDRDAGLGVLIGRPDPATATDAINGQVELTLDRNEVPKDSINIQ